MFHLLENVNISPKTIKKILDCTKFKIHSMFQPNFRFPKLSVLLYHNSLLLFVIVDERRRLHLPYQPFLTHYIDYMEDFSDHTSTKEGAKRHVNVGLKRLWEYDLSNKTNPYSSRGNVN